MKATRRQVLAAGAVALVGGASAASVEPRDEDILAVLRGFEGQRAVMVVKEGGIDADELLLPACDLPEHVELGGLYRLQFTRSREACL